MYIASESLLWKTKIPPRETDKQGTSIIRMVGLKLDRVSMGRLKGDGGGEYHRGPSA